MNRQGVVLGIDIGGTNTRAGLVNGNFDLINFVMESSSRIFNTSNAVERLAAFIKEYLEKNSEGRTIEAISIGFPSTIDKDRRKVLSTPSMKPLNNIEVVAPVEELTGIPVYINKDVNMLFLYDVNYHKLPSDATILGFYAGTGFGNAISIEGKLLLGKNGAAGELGHIPVIGSNKPCGCGNEGCMETYASGRYLEKLSEENFPETPIKKVFSQHCDHAVIDTFVDFLSVPIAAEINILDPDYIILGGGVLQMPDFPKEKLERFIHKHTRKPYPDNNLEIVYSVEAQANGVIGAGIYGFMSMEAHEHFQ